MQHLRSPCDAGCRIDLPALGGGLDQQAAGGGAGLPQWGEGAADRGGSAGALHLQQRLLVARLIGRRGHHLDLVEPDFQFLGDQHRLAGVDPLTHLHIGDDQGDLRRRADADEGPGLEADEAGPRHNVDFLVADGLGAARIDPLIGSLLGPGLAMAPGEGQHQPAAQQHPPAVRDDLQALGVDQLAAHAPAARLRAARMRG